MCHGKPTVHSVVPMLCYAQWSCSKLWFFRITKLQNVVYLEAFLVFFSADLFFIEISSEFQKMYSGVFFSSEPLHCTSYRGFVFWCTKYVLLQICIIHTRTRTYSTYSNHRHTKKTETTFIKLNSTKHLRGEWITTMTPSTKDALNRI